MEIALYILAALAAVGLILYIIDRRQRPEAAETSSDPDADSADSADSGCCGMHITCERDSLLAAVMILTNTTAWADLYRLGMFLVPPLVQFGYDGLPGRKTVLSKWGFYVFYPLHLLLLGLLRY